ncbi:MAG: hypothetical protein NVS3B18_03260 [Candidatus Dormibacteria bacterium]
MSTVPTEVDQPTLIRGGDLTLSGRPQPWGLTPAQLTPSLDDQLHALHARSGQLDAELRQTVLRRAGVRLDLETAETERRRVRTSPQLEYGALAELSQRCLSLRSELARVEAHASGLRERLSGVKSQLVALQEFRDGIEPALGISPRLPERAAALEQTTRRLYRLVDAELDALDAELHAGPIQRLSDVVMEAEILSRELARGEARSGAPLRRRLLLASTMLRDFIDRVRPADASADALSTSLRALARSYQNRGVRVAVTIAGHERPLPPALVAVVHRVAEAALDNARRHAGVDRASLALALTANRLTLVVRDDGDGFDVAATEARLGRSRCLGLLTMRERAVLHGGRLEVRSETGVGTEVRLSLPL